MFNPESGVSHVVPQSAAATTHLPTAGGPWRYHWTWTWSSAACPRCHILLVEAHSNAVSDLAASVTTAASLGADAISNSYGLDEFGGMQAFYADYRPVTAAVVACMPATSGSARRSSRPSRPASPAAGGTSLYKSGNRRGWVEHAWSGAGSGCSAYVKKPSYQHDPRLRHAHHRRRVIRR